MKKIKLIIAKLVKIESLPIILVYFVLMVVFIITATKVFTGYRIYMSFLQTVPPLLILALGLTFVITAGEMDLSFSAIIAFSGFIFCFIFRTFGTPWLAFILALLSGALVGYINGLLVAKVGIPSIMATLASQFFWNGLTILLSRGLSWNIKEIRPYFIHTLFVGRIGGIVPAQSLWGVGVAVFLWFILNRHTFGEHILFIGDNVDVARVMGVNVTATKIKLFVFMGVISAFAGILLTLEMINFWTTQGAGLLLPTIAAVFIGGTSLAGGYGTVIGSFFGAYIVGSLEAGVVASGIGGYWTRLVTGLVMAASVSLNIVLSREKGKGLKEKLRESVFLKDFNKIKK
ncbi:MAG: ABC transporter permease [Candidatus Atribacteria bacterium]